MSKYKDIHKWLKRKILAGDFSSGERLPTCRELAEIRNVSYVTVTKAIKELEADGLVSSRQGQGIVVKPIEKHLPVQPQRSAQVGFIIQTSGDLFGNYFTPLMEELSADNMMAVPLATDATLRALSPLERIKRFNSYAAAGFEALVVDGDRGFPFSALQSAAEQFKQLIFVLRYDTEIELPMANILTADFRLAGYDAAKHLLEQGVERIAMLTFEEFSAVERRASGCTYHTHDQLVLDGIEAAYADAKVDFNDNCVMLRSPDQAGSESQHKKNVGNFIDGGAPCGFICIGDIRARCVYQVARQKRLKIGRDIFVVGMFNTSWSEAFQPRLSTISIEERTISQLTMQALREKWHGRKVTVAPRLLIKESSIKES